MLDIMLPLRGFVEIMGVIILLAISINLLQTTVLISRRTIRK